MLIDKQGRSRSATPLPPVVQSPLPTSEPLVVTSGPKDSFLSRLTFGLCSTKPELIEVLISTDQE